MILIHLPNPQTTLWTTTMGPWAWFIHVNHIHSQVVSKICESSTTLLWQCCCDRFHWQGCSERSLRYGCSEKVALTGRSDRLLWQTTCTGHSDRLFWKAQPTLTSTSANVVWPILPTYSSFNLGTLVVTNNGSHTTQILYYGTYVHLEYTTSSAAVVCEMSRYSNSILSLKDSPSFTEILSISLAKFCL